MKNKITIFALLIVIAIPQVASAAWWNPLTWFEAKSDTSLPVENIKPESQVDKDISNESNIDNNRVVETKTIEKEIVKEMPIEKIVEKVITKPDQSVIDENNKLKLTIKDLEAKVSKYVAEIDTLKKKIQELEKPLTQSEIRKKEIVVELAKVDAGIAILDTKGGQYVGSGDTLNYHNIQICRTGEPSSLKSALYKNSSISVSSTYPNQFCFSKDFTYNELIVLRGELRVDLANLE